jgi:hypothetical protein
MATRNQSGLDTGRLVVLGVCLAVAVYFWHSAVLLPVKLLVVTMHESGHALAALLVGGHVQRLVIAANESGECVSNLPPGFFRETLVYSAGYLGSTLAGAGLLILTFRYRLRRLVLGAMAVWIGVVAVWLAGSPFTFAFCGGTALVLGIIAWKFKDTVVEWLDLFLASFTGLYAIFDLRDDLWNGAVRPHSDAGLLASVTGVPALVWALVWSGLALLTLALATSVAVRGKRVLTPAARPGARLSM